jgi:MFS transporter, OPA family, glycerol-3-phosphate transporter
MLSFLRQPDPAPRLPDAQIAPTYKRLRLKVFMGIFIGYAGYYFVRNNLSMVKPDLVNAGFSAGELGNIGFWFATAYGLSKFLMGAVSDRSNVRYFMPLGLLLSVCIMFTLGWMPFATSTILVLSILLFLNGWVQGMGWPPSGKSMVHWFSIRERGTKMAIWNTAHNVGGAAMAQLGVLGLLIFSDWQAKFYFPGMVALLVVVFMYWMLRSTPQSEGLPPVEEWKNDYPPAYDSSLDRTLSFKEIFFKYVFPNKLLWFIALANAFVYLVRYGISDWAFLYLEKTKGFDFAESGFGYAAYELAGIPGTLLCGWLSDKLFKGRRAPASILYLALTAIAIVVYWLNPVGNPHIDIACLFAIGFLIYGPVMLIGVHALDLAPKNAAGTAAGFTGLFGYFLGTAILANLATGYLIELYSWTGYFVTMLSACALAILLLAFTWRRED